MRTDTLSTAWIFCTGTQPIQNKEQYYYFPYTFVLEGGRKELIMNLKVLDGRVFEG